MEYISETSGRKYEILEAVEPRISKKEETSDILVIFDWRGEDESPEIVGYMWGAKFIEQELDVVQEKITEYEKKNNLIEIDLE